MSFSINAYTSQLSRSILAKVKSRLAEVGLEMPNVAKPGTPNGGQIASYFQDRFEDAGSSRRVTPGFTPARVTPSTTTSPSPSRVDATKSGANPDAVAQQIAQDATGWTYDNTGGKTWSGTLANENRFDRTKSGVCTDMAAEAAQRFEDAGVNARVVFGKTDRGNHAWVEYQDASGQWKAFDPTAAACTKNAGAAITPMDNGVYNYGSTFDRYEPPAGL